MHIFIHVFQKVQFSSSSFNFSIKLQLGSQNVHGQEWHLGFSPLGCLLCARFYFAQLSMRLLWKCGSFLLWEFMHTKRPAFQKEHWEPRAQEKGLLKLMNHSNLFWRVPRNTIKQKVTCCCYFSYMLLLQILGFNRVNCPYSEAWANNF